MSAIQAVHIRSYEERSQPKQHIVYKIEIQANVRSWLMWRRYSEFDDLHTELTKTTGSPPPHPLPPKHKLSVFRFGTDLKIVKERRVGLEAYLRAIVGAKDDKWREAYAFKEFLGIPITRQAAHAGPQQFTVSSWLDEHVELQSRIRDVRADVNRRDTLSDNGDIAASHKSNVGAKQKLAGVLTRVNALEDGLKELGMGGLSEGELQRRTDMVARLRDDCEKLARMVTVARLSSRQQFGTSAATMNPASDSDREALLGSHAVKPKPVGRVFGAGALSKAVETEETRPLDDQGLMGLHQVQIERQDQELSQLTAILSRQKQLGLAIGNEIHYQNELLDELTNDVDTVGGKLSSANKQMNRLRQ